MAKQFEPVDCSRGAPMGRREWLEAPTKPHSVRVFRVRLDSGGYDDGGAYMNYSQAAQELGACIMHMQACNGELDNRTRAEAQ